MKRGFHRNAFAAAALTIVTAWLSSNAAAQTVAPPFDESYTLNDIGPVPGLPTFYGGLTVKLGDTDTLLIGGSANQATGALYTIGLVREDDGHIIGFDGEATFFAEAAYNDGGVVYGPGGVMFLARWPVNELGQIKPGSSVTDKIIDLVPFGVAQSHAALNFVPPGYVNAGHLKLVSWSGGEWYDAIISPDAEGTFNLASVTAVPESTVPGGPEGFIYVPPGSPLFDVPSMLVSEWSDGNIAAYEASELGDPIVATRQDFVVGLNGAEGAAIDPITGDFLFSTFDAVDRVIVIQGFTAPPPPCPADLNGDGQVDGADLGLLLGNWAGSGLGDLDANGLVDGADLGLLLGDWGPCPSR